VLARDDQQVPSCRRGDVHERDRPLVLGDDLAGQLAGDDLAEDAVRVSHGPKPIPTGRFLGKSVLGRDHEGIRVIPAVQRRGCLVPEDPGGAVVGGHRRAGIGACQRHSR
jgi:hypothetical protein